MNGSTENSLRPVNLLKDGLRALFVPPVGNLPALDVLRSLAILLVFSGHFAAEFHLPPGMGGAPVYYSWTGVDLFFVLSGFLIGLQLWKELKRTGTIRVGEFLLRRGFRIWPLYFSLAALLLLEVIFFGRPVSGLLADVTFLSNYFHCQIGGGWSLSTEEQFYIITPVCLYFLARKVDAGWLWMVPAAGLTITIACRIWVVSHSPLPLRALQQVLYFPIHTHCDGLFSGLFLAWLTVFRPRVLASLRSALGCALAMAVTGVLLYAVNRLLFNFTALALIFGGATLLGSDISRTPRFLAWRGFYIVSRLSYGLYLNHFGLLPRLEVVLGRFHPEQGGLTLWFCYGMSLFCCLAFAAFTFSLIEYPFLALRARWLTGMRDRSA